LTGILQTTVTGLSIDEVAGRFEVSRRTAERMLGALRDRFPDLEPIYRTGRKYWRLPATSHARPIQLPRTLSTLSERIVKLEAEVCETRSAAEDIRGITEGVLGSSHVGMLVIDANFHVVYVNDAFELFVGLDRSEVVGHDMRELIPRTLEHVFADPERFASRVLAAYDDNSYIENFECHVSAQGDRPERWLEHWSRPISSGRFAGGRVDHYIDISARIRGDEHDPSRVASAASSSTQGLSPSEPTELREPLESTTILSEHFDVLLQAAEQVLADDDVPSELARRLVAVVESHREVFSENMEISKRGQTKAEAISVPAVIQTTVSLLREDAKAREIQLIVDIPRECPAILADRSLTILGLTTAGRNSIRTLPKGATIEFRAEHLHAPERVRVSIIDDGDGAEGIPEVKSTMTPTRTSALGVGILAARDADGKPTGGMIQYFEQPAHYRSQSS
jgi:PAS domain S-box-containing protein